MNELIEVIAMIETERLFLRKPQSDDLAGWTTFFTSERARFVGGGKGKTDLAWRVYAIFLGHWALHQTGPFVICRKDSQKAIGMAGPWYPNGWPEKELTWSIWSTENEGQGFAAEAVTALGTHAYEDLKWSRAVSYIDPDNAASIRLAERIGCVLDARAPTPDDDPTLVYVHPKE
ncbi:GNAT family N-acetyltransferase [Ruegeria sp. R13_0]|uniref:GNAT family N-acetyltransferase n=1 Tax=Ruegeria sp. R13_0 TaxID=2821099 RepID=UPI001FFE232F|nr:GNAT family N-acetyltransferase [Ruegeria sp. R13_0]